MSSDIAAIDAELARLQAQRDVAVAKARAAAEREEREAAKILIGSTPKKDKVKETIMPEKPKQPMFASAASLPNKARPPKQELPSLPSSSTAGPSRMGGALAALRKASSPAIRPSAIVSPSRSQSLSNTSRLIGQNAQAGPSRPLGNRAGTGKSKEAGVDELEVAAPGRSGSTKQSSAGGRTMKRDEDSLVVVEDLQPGPKDFGRDPDGEFGWERLEPNSKLRLSKRVMAHSTVQDQLYGRFHLTPSMLYSVIRMSRDGATYDIPVEGEWVTIAVVAERGEVRVSGYKDASDSESDGEDDSKQVGPSKPDAKQVQAGKTGGAPKKGQAPRKRRAKKYINLKLAALPPRSSTTAGATTAGDALLQLLLFEADHVVRMDDDVGGKGKIKYKGGSGGAYEKWCNLNPGDVIGLINPKVLRPLKSGSSAPHPMTLPLALNPYSGDSIFLIGQCRDIGQCSAIQRDGKRCTSWVDTRQSAVCEYHVHLAIQRQKGARAEFTASTSSFQLQSRPNAARGGFGGAGGKAGVNHQTKTGLLPANGPQAAPRGIENGGGGVTYVVGGGVIRSSGQEGGLKGWGDEHLGEKLGRSRAEKRKKRMNDKEAEEALSRLVGQKQGVGGQYLAAADRHRKAQEEAEEALSGRAKRVKRPEKDKVQEGGEENTRKTFSADSIKKIGFDPTSLSSNPRYMDKIDKRRKADAIASLKTVRREFDPDAKVKRANVRAPPAPPIATGLSSVAAKVTAEDGDGDMIDLD